MSKKVADGKKPRRFGKTNSLDGGDPFEQIRERGFATMSAASVVSAGTLSGSGGSTLDFHGDLPASQHYGAGAVEAYTKHDKPSTGSGRSKCVPVVAVVAGTVTLGAATAGALVLLFRASGERSPDLEADTSGDRLNPSGELLDDAATMSRSSPVSDSKSTEYWQLDWADEFDYIGHADSSKWAYVDKGDGFGNNEAQWYKEKDRANAYVENGALRITPLQANYRGKNFTSAKLQTKGRADWGPGTRVSIRAKMPKGKGPWSAFWMLPSYKKHGGWPHSGEIDIMEYVGKWDGKILGTVHTGAYNHKKGTHIGDSLIVADAEQEFHVYTLEWWTDKMDWYVDGNLYHTFYNWSNGSSEKWPFDEKFYLILNVAIGGDLGGYIDAGSLGPNNSLLIDWVRVYSAKSGEIAGAVDEVTYVAADRRCHSTRACDKGDCYTCAARKEWLTNTKKMPAEDALRAVAEQFPEECGCLVVVSHNDHDGPGGWGPNGPPQNDNSDDHDGPGGWGPNGPPQNDNSDDHDGPGGWGPNGPPQPPNNGGGGSTADGWSRSGNLDFRVFKQQKTFAEAEAFCKNLDPASSVAEITSREQNRAVREAAAKEDCAECKLWIGIKRGTWDDKMKLWVTPSHNNDVAWYDNWSKKKGYEQPDDYGYDKRTHKGGEDCVILCDPKDVWCEAEDKWADFTCSDTASAFVCGKKATGVAPPAPRGSARALVRGRPAANLPSWGTTLKVLSGNLFWWNLYRQRKGNGNSMGRLYHQNDAKNIDIFGLQECDDVTVIHANAGLKETHRYKSFEHALAMMWKTDVFGKHELASGCAPVAKDKPGYWGRRYVCWVRLEHKPTGNKVWFGNHHGALPVNTGGAWGSEQWALNTKALIHETSEPDDLIVLLGDWNNGVTSQTLKKMQFFLDHVPVNHKGHHFDYDNVFVNKGLVDAAESEGQKVKAYSIGEGGSDHPQIKAEIFIPGW